MRRTWLLALVLCASPLAFGGATITIVNANAPGIGFNDSTPASPVGGNNGTTVGEQRLIAFQFAANIWGANLNSNVEIKVNAQFTALSCTANSGVLGSAGATGSTANFANAEFTSTWYPITLASARAGSDLTNPAGPHINANFNSNVGNQGCLENSSWYYGLDTVTPSGKINLVAVVLHELGHGLGFSLGPTSSSTGTHAQNLPSIYERKMFDAGTGKAWIDMTDGERVTSAVNTNNVVWTGAQVLAAAPGVLGTPTLQITAPPGIAGPYTVGTAAFGPRLTGSALAGELIQALDPNDANGTQTTDACSALTNPGQVSGKVAVVVRGTCSFKTKTKNAQDAGAIAVVVVNNAAGNPITMAEDATITAAITIPTVMVTQTDGLNIGNQLAVGTTVNGSLALNPSQAPGTDAQGRPKLYAPNPLEPGSSISHWDTSAVPNQLMEPNISSDLTHNVKPPHDLTVPLLVDIGWTAATPTATAQPSTSALAFGNRLIGFGTFAANVGFTNTGATSVTISNVALTGSGEFSRTHNCPGTLAAGASCNIVVSYTPGAQSQQTATLAITSNAAGSPHNIAVSGTGVTDLTLSLTRPVRPPRAGLGQGQSLEFEVAALGGVREQGIAWACVASAGVRCAVAATSEGGLAQVIVTNLTRSRRLRTRATQTAVVRVTATSGGVRATLEVPVVVQK